MAADDAQKHVHYDLGKNIDTGQLRIPLRLLLGVVETERQRLLQKQPLLWPQEG